MPRRPVPVAAMALLVAVAAPVRGAAPPASDPPWIAAIKVAAQTDPARGLALATAAEQRLAAQPAGMGRTIDRLTAQWLAEEALIRLNRTEEASRRVDATLRDLPPEATHQKLHGDLLMVRARVRSAKGRSADALADFQAAHQIFAGIGQHRSQAVALMGIGSIYQNAGDFERVLSYYRLAAETYPGDVMLALSSSNNQANALADLHRYAEAETEYGVALRYARQAKSPLLEVRILNNIASTQIDRGALAAAARTLAGGLVLAATPAAADWRPVMLGTAARLELARHRPREAVRLIRTAVAGKSAADLNDQTYRDLNFTAYQAYERIGDQRQALAYFKTVTGLDDAARTVATQTNATLLAARFDFARQNARISTLKAGQLERDIALSALGARQRALILAGLLSLVSIVAIGLFIYLRALSRSRNAIRAANAELSTVNVELEHALAAKTQFLATTSHEIRTPLNGVLGMTQVLLADAALPAPTRDRVAVVHSAGETMLRLVDDILDYAKIDAGAADIDLADMDLHALLGDTRRLWTDRAASKSLTLELELTDTPRHVIGDARRLRQVLDNLLSNAIKFTASGTVAITASTRHDQLVIAVADSGIGIPEAATALIFEPFRQLDGSTTRQFGGTGLGLAIARRIATAMGGTLSVTTKLGHGSTFSLTLPLRVPAAASATGPTPVAMPAASLGRAHILLVGGSPIGQSAIKSLLAGQVGGFTAAPTADDPRAVAAAATADVIILDRATLGDAVAGAFFEQVAGTRTIMPRWLAIDADTGTDGEPEPTRGFDRRLVKPLTAAALLDAMHELFMISNEIEVAADEMVSDG